MILVIDVGNTNIVLGAYEESQLIAYWRMTTTSNRTADEMGMFMYGLFSQQKLEVEKLEQVMICSVVPDIMYSLKHAIRKYFNKDPLIVGPGIKTGMNIRIENPKELGADRLVNAVAGMELYGVPNIVIDFGTATTYDIVDASGAFISGITSPGIRICADALWQRAAQLPKVEIKKPKSIMAKNTIESLQAGLVYGYIGQVEYIVRKIQEEMNLPHIKVIATGGLAKIIDEGTDIFDEYNPFLTLEGLRILYEKNK